MRCPEGAGGAQVTSPWISSAEPHEVQLQQDLLRLQLELQDQKEEEKVERVGRMYAQSQLVDMQSPDTHHGQAARSSSGLNAHAIYTPPASAQQGPPIVHYYAQDTRPLQRDSNEVHGYYAQDVRSLRRDSKELHGHAQTEQSAQGVRTLQTDAEATIDARQIRQQPRFSPFLIPLLKDRCQRRVTGVCHVSPHRTRMRQFPRWQLFYLSRSFKVLVCRKKSPLRSFLTPPRCICG